MPLRRCPECRTSVEPKVEDGLELCPKCELLLPAAEKVATAPPPPRPPEPPPPRRATAKPVRERDERPEREERRERSDTAVADPPRNALMVAMMLLVGGFVLLVFFITGVIEVKTQFKATPTNNLKSNQFNPDGTWGGQPPITKRADGPWGGPPPFTSKP